jgi:orotidine-5'-phosphate decarboxylase
VGQHGSTADQVRRLAALAQKSGLDGVVCSAREVAALRAECGPNFKLVVPGIRPTWSTAQDQKRIMGPADAIRQGADYLVVGRPITGAPDPRAAARSIAQEIAKGADKGAGA